MPNSRKASHKPRPAVRREKIVAKWLEGCAEWFGCDKCPFNEERDDECCRLAEEVISKEKTERDRLAKLKHAKKRRQRC